MATPEMAARIAPEVDRLVWAIWPSIPPTDRERLSEAVTQAGLSNLGFGTNFGDFFLHEGIAFDVAKLRQAYADPDELDAWFRSLSDNALIAQPDHLWVATEDGRPLFSLLTTLQNRTATNLWRSHHSEVGTAVDLATAVVSNASPDHTVAAAHREIPVPDEPAAALYRRLVNLRYLRQHDHIAAWESAGLTAPEMVILTELWHGGVADDSSALESLIEKGLVTELGTLTSDGRDAREGIEVQTNERNAEDFAVLGNDGAQILLDALGALPPH